MRGRVLGSSATLVGLVVGLVAVVAGPAGAKTVTTAESRDGIVFRTITVDDQTRLDRVSPDEHLVVTLDEPLTVRLVEPGGRRVVLGTPLAEGADLYHPGGRASTHLVVVDVATGGTRAYDLARNVEPEAFGVDSPALFLIDHHPARDPSYYRVASMNLETGEFWRLLGPDKQPLENMVGTARQQVYSASGRQLYTLYTQPRDIDVSAKSHVPDESFVHVLDLTGNWAYCVDLPESFGRGPTRSAGIALDPSGNTLFVADARAHKLVALDTRRLDGNALTNHEPPLTVTALPSAVKRHSAILLTTTATGVSITAGVARFTYDPTTAAWTTS
jgi:hypothetical protein